MDKEELETREKLKLKNIAIEWLGTEHSEGNIQSLVNLISNFIEPREKRIEELEQKLEQTEKDLADYQFNYPTIKELEKENAELKDYRLKTLAKQQTEMSKYALNLEKKLSWYDTQHTKAKELLKQIMYASKDCIFDIEQFLKEIEK